MPSFDRPRKRPERPHPTKLHDLVRGPVEGDPRRLDEEARHEDGQYPDEGDKVVPLVVEPLGLRAVPSYHRHDDADDGGQPGKVKEEREDQVEVAVQVSDAEEGPEKVILEGDEARAYGKDQKPPEDEEVHEPRIRFAGAQDRSCEKWRS